MVVGEPAAEFHQPGYGEIRHLLLSDLIADIHTRSRGTYGMLRIRTALEIEQGLGDVDNPRMNGTNRGNNDCY